MVQWLRAFFEAGHRMRASRDEPRFPRRHHFFRDVRLPTGRASPAALQRLRQLQSICTSPQLTEALDCRMDEAAGRHVAMLEGWRAPPACSTTIGAGEPADGVIARAAIMGQYDLFVNDTFRSFTGMRCTCAIGMVAAMLVGLGQLAHRASASLVLPAKTVAWDLDAVAGTITDSRDRLNGRRHRPAVHHSWRDGVGVALLFPPSGAPPYLSSVRANSCMDARRSEHRREPLSRAQGKVMPITSITTRRCRCRRWVAHIDCRRIPKSAWRCAPLCSTSEPQPTTWR